MSVLALLFACTSATERGEQALARDDLLAAEREFRAALDADPEDAEALYGLGWTFHQADEDGPARDAFERLVRTHPELPSGYRGLGSLFAAAGNLPEARKQLEEALKRAPDDPSVNQSLALVELAEEKPEAALSRIDAALAKNPGRPELLQTRAVALLKLDRAEEALEQAAAAVAAADSARSLTAARLTWVSAVLDNVEDRVDASNCGTTAAPVRAWLDGADHVLDEAEADGALHDTTLDTRKLVRRRRGWLEDICAPGGGK